MTFRPYSAVIGDDDIDRPARHIIAQIQSERPLTCRQIRDRLRVLLQPGERFLRVGRVPV